MVNLCYRFHDVVVVEPQFQVFKEDGLSFGIHLSTDADGGSGEPTWTDLKFRPMIVQDVHLYLREQ